MKGVPDGRWCCGVRGCEYLAEMLDDERGDFPVCALHDCPAVKAILDAMKGGPHHYWWSSGRPIVTPCKAQLDLDWFELRPAGDKAVLALDCPKLRGVGLDPDLRVYTDFDPLIRE